VPDLPWFVYAMLLAPLGLILFAAIYKTLQVRVASDWPSTPGKVVTSNSEVREVKVLDSGRESGHKFEERNFANVVYEYSVSGQTLNNNRVSIGEDPGDFPVAEIIARYPVGTVVSVYYNPLHPHDAVLERGLPQGLWRCLGIATAVALVIVFGSAIGLHRISEFFSARLGNPQMSVPVMALAAFGLVAVLFAQVLRQQAARVRQWPIVAGIIKLSGFEEYRTAASDNGSRGTRMYSREVSYTYRYNHIAYSNVHASLSSNSRTMSPWALRLWGMDYQEGASVKVWVNPDNPSEATLNPEVPLGGCCGWSHWRCGWRRIRLRQRPKTGCLPRNRCLPRLRGREPSIRCGDAQLKQPLRPRHGFDLGKNPRQPVRPLPLAGLIGDQVLANLDA
jgi:hypothetical protein